MSLMNLSLRQLRAFAAVAELSQFTLAAERLHITQSALSMLIRELEKELGVKMFDRHTRMVRLTESGKEFLVTVRRILAELENGVAQTRELATYKRGRVTIASATVLAATLLVPFMREFAQQQPGIKLVLRDMAEEQISSNLVDGEVDLGVGTLLKPQSEIMETPLFSDQFMAILPKGHPLARKTQIPWSALDHHPFISMAPSSSIRALLENHLRELDIKPNVAYETSFPSTVFAMVRNGMGIAVLPANSRQLMSMSNIVCRKMGKPVFRRTVCTFRVRNRSLSPAAELFHAALLDYAAHNRSKLIASL